jgi:hypothetical protein
MGSFYGPLASQLFNVPLLTTVTTINIWQNGLTSLPIWTKLKKLSILNLQDCDRLTNISSPVTIGATVPLISTVNLINLAVLPSIPYWMFSKGNGTYLFQQLPLITTFNLTSLDAPNVTDVASLIIDTVPLTTFNVPTLRYIGIMQLNNWNVWGTTAIWPALQYCGSLTLSVSGSPLHTLLICTALISYNNRTRIWFKLQVHR